MKLVLLIALLSLISFTTHAQDVVIDDDLISAWDEEFPAEETDYWPSEEGSFQYQEDLWNVIDADLEVQDSVEFLVEYLVDWGVNEGILEDGAIYELDTVNLIQQYPTDPTFNYYFLDLSNNQGDVERFWVGLSDPETGKRTASFPYNIEPLLLSENGMNFLERSWPISLTWEQFKDNEYDSRRVFFWGLNNVVDRAVAAGVFENDQYTVSRLYIASIDQTADGDTYYLFDIYFKPHSTDYWAEAIFTVRESANGTLEIEKYVLFPA